MKPSIWMLACLLVLSMGACSPQPTEIPPTALSAATSIPPTVPRLVHPTDRETYTAEPLPTVLPQTPEPSPLPTARPHQYDDADESAILAAVYPGLTLTPDSQGYQVQGSPDWVVWVNDREEGHLTQSQRGELVAIVANQVGASPPKEEAAYGATGDYIVILEKNDGKLVVTHRDSFTPPVSPLSTDVRIERAADLAHSGQDDLLITTNAVQSLVIHTEAHLFRWQGGKWVELWNGVEQDDNTAAVNQTEYSAYQATVDFADLDGDGVDEIIVTGKRTFYSRDADGRADLVAPSSVSEERSVYDWNGSAFVLEPGLTTPPVPAPTPTSSP